MTQATVHIGIAGWSIPKEHAGHFSAVGSHLERYGTYFNAIEINSSYYRSHKPASYARWAASVPPNFRFAAKMPRTITHERLLIGVSDLLERFLGEVEALGENLGPLLVQLPPKLAFVARNVREFFAALRGRFAGNVVCEPRHVSWFRPEAGQLLKDFAVAQVAADPALVAAAAEPGGWEGLVYFRLHGSPQMYYSPYSTDHLVALAARLKRFAVPTWCIFDNTAQLAAIPNAIELCDLVMRK